MTNLKPQLLSVAPNFSKLGITWALNFLVLISISEYRCKKIMHIYAENTLTECSKMATKDLMGTCPFSQTSDTGLKPQSCAYGKVRL